MNVSLSNLTMKFSKIHFGLLLLFLYFCNVGSIFLPLIRKSHNVPEISKRGSGEPIVLQGGISTLAAFYTTISMGTPAQQFLVLIDTGKKKLLNLLLFLFLFF